MKLASMDLLLVCSQGSRLMKLAGFSSDAAYEAGGYGPAACMLAGVAAYEARWVRPMRIASFTISAIALRLSAMHAQEDRLAPGCPPHGSPMLLSPRRVPCTINTNATHDRGASVHERPAASCPPHCSPMLPSPRQVPCALSTSVSPIKHASLAREASAQPLSALQPDAAIAKPSAKHAHSERDSP